MNHKLLRYLYAFLCAFIFAVCQSLMFTLYPVIAKQLSISLAELIAVFGFGSSLFFIGSPFWTSCSERLGRIKTLCVCMLGLSISLALLLAALQGASSNYLWASRIVYGIFAGGIVPISQALFAEGAPKNLLSNFALHAQSTTFGRIVGPVVGLIAARGDLALVFELLFAISLILTTGSFFMKDVRSKDKRALDAIVMIPQVKYLPILCVLVVCFAIVVISIQSTLAALFKQQIIDFDKFTIANSCIFIGGNVVMMINQKLMKHYKESSLIALGSALFVSASTLFVISSVWQLSAIAYVIFCLGFSNLRVGIMAYFCRKNEELRSSVIAVISLVQTCGYALGSMIVASLLQTSLSLVYMGALTASFVLVGFVVLERNKRVNGRLYHV